MAINIRLCVATRLGQLITLDCIILGSPNVEDTCVAPFTFGTPATPFENKVRTYQVAVFEDCKSIEEP